MWKDLPDDREPRVVLVGVPLHRLSRNHQLPCLAVLVLCSSILAAALQERVLYVPGFRYTGWLAFLTSMTYMALAIIERTVEKDWLRRGGFAEYVKLSFLTMGGMYLTNFSLHYLSYSLRVVFKSSKLVPVMLLGVVYLKKRYTLSQYVAVGLLTTGVVVFTLGDAKGRAFFNPMGIAFILAGSMSDAMAANYEEKLFFSRMGCSASEVVLYSNALGSVWALLAGAFTGELLPALGHSWDHMEAVPLMLLASCFGYIAQTGVLLLIKHFGATAAEIVKSCRKVTTILISFIVYGKPWNGYHVAGIFMFLNSVAVERFNSGASSRRFAALLSCTGLAVMCLVFRAGPSTFSVVIDAGSAGTRVNVFRFDAWTLKLLDMNGAAQIFVEEEPGVGDLNSSSLASQLTRLLAVASAAVPLGQRHVTPLALRATRALEDLSVQQVDDLLEQMKGHIAAAGFKDAGVQPMGGSEEAIAEWMTANMLMGCFQPGLRGVRSPVAIVDLGGATVQMAYYLRDHQASAARRHNLDGYISRIQLPFGSGPVHIYRHSYGGYGLHSAKVRSYKEIERAGFGLRRHPCLPSGFSVTLRVERQTVAAQGALNRFSCATLIEHILHKELPCIVQDGKAGGLPKMGNCSFAGVWMGPGLGDQRVVLASYFYDRMRDVGMVSNYSQAIRASVFAEQADRACSVTAFGLNRSAFEFPNLSWDRLVWLCFDLTFQAHLLQALGLADRELLVVKKIRYHDLDFEASWALGVAIGQLNA